MTREEALDIQIKGGQVLYVPENKVVQISQLPYAHQAKNWACISIRNEKGSLAWTKKVNLSELSLP